MTDLDEEFASAVRRARDARPGLRFGLSLVAGANVDGSLVTISSGPRLSGDVRVTPPPSLRSRSKSRSRAMSSIGGSELSDEGFFTAGSRTSSDSWASSFFLTLSYTDSREPTTSTDRTVTGLGITSGSGTNIVPSTLSYRCTDSASFLGDSHTGSGPQTSDTYTPTSPSRSTATRSRRLSGRASSRTFSSGYSYPSIEDESSDKENTDDYTHSGTRSTGGWTTGSSPRTELPTEEEEDRTPPPSSLGSPPTIPSSLDYAMAEVCSTEYETAEVCSTEFSMAEVCTERMTEFSTADVCTERETEFSTAEVCSTEPKTEYDTAKCVCVPVPSVTEEEVEESVEEEEVEHVLEDQRPEEPEEPTPVVVVPEEDHANEEESEEAEVTSIMSPPSEIAIIPSTLETESEIYPKEVPLPPSTYSPSIPSTELLSLEILEPSSMSSPSEITISSPEESTQVSVISPSPSMPIASIPSSPMTLSMSIQTESSITPTPTKRTPSVVSSSLSVSQPTPATPSIRESLWASESDKSYESSVLQASPSIRSLAVPEGMDTSYDTSFLRPSGSIISTEVLGRLTPITEVPSSIMPSSPTSITATPNSVSTPTSVVTPTLTRQSSVTVTRTPPSVSTASSISMRSSVFDARLLYDYEISEPSELSLLSTHRSPPSPVWRAFSLAMVPLPCSPAPSTSSVSIGGPAMPSPIVVPSPCPWCSFQGFR
ncbi:hypothetical protein JAAARDRAFT_195742 [Jaapia argillacea MUCL 33604]|uniref:Uncharacterized protein n=1 Tax=Jaapia argillacea MUCL 33604 TaxID=933084 RepID=A0A067PVN5_9AGAM|nr:hypothetical protein JAAARDRAFT_195742 [Jaapia argillacea MUCL 33604]